MATTSGAVVPASPMAPMAPTEAPMPADRGLARREGRALGSPLRLTVAAGEAIEGETIVDEAWPAVLKIFSAVDAAMSRFREDSELTALCRLSPDPARGVSRMLVKALVAADRARRITAGRFDPRIVDALEQIGYAGAAQHRAAPAEHAGGSARRRIVLRTGRDGPVALPEPVDLGGIGKGLALRWAADAIDGLVTGPARRRLAGGYLLDAGGDIVLAGRPAVGEPWHIGIEDPMSPVAPIATLKAVGCLAVATSSIRRLRWERDGQVVHHLIDPRTGAPADGGLAAVTVAGPDPAWAEVWSKSLFVEGAAGVAAVARRRGLAAWWVTTDGRLEMTPAARQRTTWVAAEV